MDLISQTVPRQCNFEQYFDNFVTEFNDKFDFDIVPLMDPMVHKN